MDIFDTGPVVPGGPALLPDKDARLDGRSVRIRPVAAARDAAALFAATHGEDSDPGQWTYMSYGPFADEAAMQQWLEEIQASSDPLFMVVRDAGSDAPLGVVSYLNIEPTHRTIELGNIWYVPGARRTAVNTETIYLLLKDCFERLGYRRVEWKCDNLNERSKSAAIRLGFRFEGVFRQHFIVKGRNRDTAWFAVVDKDWEVLKANFEQVLYDAECTVSLRELNEKIHE
ncbi:MAG: GNAT family N-acetyltransferase [Gammaproteobacteria bacterium]|nr:GNAT family N-acetyltransferase [Gammaproteobacteria bacterium]